MREFLTAARDDFSPEDTDSVIMKHDGREVEFYEPSTAQAALLMQLGRAKADHNSVSAFMALMFEIMEEGTQTYFQNRLMDRLDPFDVDGEGGLFEIWSALSEHWSARPTQAPTDYQPSQRASGRASTASSRAKASTSSRSRSRASSQ